MKPSRHPLRIEPGPPGASRVLLLNPPGSRLYLRDQYCCSVSKANYYWPPIDLLALSGLLSGRCAIGVLDAIIERMSADVALETIRSFRPDAVLFMTGVAAWQEDLPFMRRVKETTRARLVGMGGLLLHEGESIMEREPALDAVLLDFTSPAILDFLADAPDNDQPIPNMIRRANGKPLRGPRAFGGPAFEIPVPRHELFPLHRYRLPHGRREPLTSVLASDGCPHRCDYCIAGSMPYRYRPLENLMAEFEHLKNLGVRELFFKDFTFGARKQRALDLCAEMVRRDLRLSWICASRIDTLDRELLTAMRAAGCHTIQYGVETADAETLRAHGKNANEDQTREVFATCRALGIRTLGHFILGLPGETRESVMRTARYARELRCDYASFNTVIPQVGTPLRERLIEAGAYRPDDATFDGGRSFPVVRTDTLSPEELWACRAKAIRSFYADPRYLLRRLAGVRTWVELRNLIGNGVALLAGD